MIFASQRFSRENMGSLAECSDLSLLFLEETTQMIRAFSSIEGTSFRPHERLRAPRTSPKYPHTSHPPTLPPTSSCHGSRCKHPSALVLLVALVIQRGESRAIACGGRRSCVRFGVSPRSSAPPTGEFERAWRIGSGSGRQGVLTAAAGRRAAGPR